MIQPNHQASLGKILKGVLSLRGLLASEGFFPRGGQKW